MDIIKAEKLGVCFGVKRALDLAYETLLSDLPKPIYSYGSLIHNSVVMEDLRRKGMRIVFSLEGIKQGTVLIRAHGVAPSIRKSMEERGLHVIDATCPKVIRSQKIIQEHKAKGEEIVIAGDRDHGEVQGLLGIAPEARVINSPRQALKLKIGKRTLLISQTTLDPRKYKGIRDVLAKSAPTLKIINSVCAETFRRQQAVRDLALKVDAVIVIGGKESANTKNLVEEARSVNQAVWHLESEADLPAEIFSYGRIGVSAGASTPDWIIEKVIKALQKKTEIV